MGEVSNTSKEAAKAFAQKHGLVAQVERDLATLLESTWQDGAQAEQTFTFLEETVFRFHGLLQRNRD